MKTYNIYLVEDHGIMRELLQEFLVMTPGLEVAGVAENAEAALQDIPTMENLHLLLIDVSLPDMSGIELAKEVRARWPELPCLMFSGHGEIAYAYRALENGARGYVLKGNPDELVEAIHHVLNGEMYISASLKNLPAENKNRPRVAGD